jgi:hypothetical protein
MPRLPSRAHDRNPGDRSLRLSRINRHLLRIGLVFNSDLHKLAFAKSAEKYFRRGLRACFTSSFCLTRRLSKSSSYHPGESASVTLSVFALSRLPSVHSTPIDRLPLSGLLQSIFRPPPQLSTFCAHRHARRRGAGLNMLCIHIAPSSVFQCSRICSGFVGSGDSVPEWRANYLA